MIARDMNNELDKAFTVKIKLLEILKQNQLIVLDPDKIK